MADTMGSSMVSSTRLGYSHISYQQMSYYLGDVVPPKMGKTLPISQFFFHQMRRKLKGQCFLTKLAQIKDMGILPIVREPFLMGGGNLLINHGLLRDKSCRFL